MMVDSLRLEVIKNIFESKPEYICVGLLTRQEIFFLFVCNMVGIIKHILFLECDSVEWYIHCVWDEKH